MKKAVIAAVIACMMITPVYADEKDDRIAAMEEKVADLETRIEAIESLFLMDSSTGEAAFYLINESGSTADDDEIIVYAAPEHDYDMIGLGISTSGFDGSQLTYIYVDDELLQKDQLSNTSTDIMLTGSALDEGAHTVKAVQYADDSESGDILLEMSEKYTVKYK